MCLYNHPLKQEREHFAVAEQKGFLRLRPKAIEGAKEKGNKAQSVQIVWGSLSEQSTSQDGEILSEATTVQEENILSFQALQGSFSQEEGSLRNGQKLVLEDDEGFSLRSFNQVRSMDPCLDEGRCGAKVSPVRVMPRLLLSLAGGEATGIQSLILQTSSPLQEDKESLAGRKGMQHLLISQASSPLKPIGSADNLELYKVDDFVKALEDSVNIMKPPRVIDNDYIAGRYEAYKNKAFHRTRERR